MDNFSKKHLYISNLKIILSQSLLLEKDKYKDYLRYGDIHRSDFNKSIIEKNNRNARYDAASAATNYLHAYFVYRFNKLTLSNETMMIWIKEENREIALLYANIMKEITT